MKLMKKFAILLIAALPFGIISCGGSIPEKLVEITVEDTGGAAPNCSPKTVSGLPGQRVRFRITNYTEQQIEFIVADDATYKKRKGIPQISETGISSNGIQRTAFIPIHDGHKDEGGDDSTEDFNYRVLIDPQRRTGPGIRTMIVTFPEVGEAAPFTNFLCSYIDATEVYVGIITRR